MPSLGLTTLVRAAKEEHLRQPQSLETHHQRMGTYLVETEATELLRVDERGKGEDNASPLSLAPTTHKDLASKISVTVERAQPRGALSPHEWKKRNSSGFFEATRLSRADSSSMRAGPGKPAAAVQSEFSFRPKQSVKISSTRRSVDSWIPVRESPGPGEYVARSSLGNMGGKFGKEQKRYDWVLRGSGAEMAYNPSKHYVS